MITFAYCDKPPRVGFESELGEEAHRGCGRNHVQVEVFDRVEGWPMKAEQQIIQVAVVVLHDGFADVHQCLDCKKDWYYLYILFVIVMFWKLFHSHSS